MDVTVGYSWGDGPRQASYTHSLAESFDRSACGYHAECVVLDYEVSSSWCPTKVETRGGYVTIPSAILHLVKPLTECERQIDRRLTADRSTALAYRYRR
ncbi:hypothetical protein EA473_04950 [Natrarchaeobius chitinivorans]|uniref:Uncharacterized protein n=1 Tax=Natrarchaeobius chitinivorans TaxID=1679083 RepID=A0A3N6MHS8_NATCH|nr:hypothetical protein EA473_04950 [Natrarchaeobius chitinivorans]